jgi:hypothetical protein
LEGEPGIGKTVLWRAGAELGQDWLAVVPAETQAALLVASALSQPTLELVGQAAGGNPEARLAPALSARVIQLDDARIRFPHPLLASGVYSATTPAKRRALHRRLADLVPDPGGARPAPRAQCGGPRSGDRIGARRRRTRR